MFNMIICFIVDISRDREYSNKRYLHLCIVVFLLLVCLINNDTLWPRKTSLLSRWRRSQWPRGLRRGFAAARLLRLWVRIPPRAWTFVCCECCVLAGTGLCDKLITRPEESYWVWRVLVCDLETSWMRRPWPTGGLLRQKQTNKKLSRWRKLCAWIWHYIVR